MPSRAAATDFAAGEKTRQPPCTALLTSYPRPTTQKSKNTKTGSEMQRDKEQVAAMMREKQKAGKALPYPRPRGACPKERQSVVGAWYDIRSNDHGFHLVQPTSAGPPKQQPARNRRPLDISTNIIISPSWQEK